MCGVPVMCEDGDYSVVEGLDLDGFQKSKLDKNIEELVGERDAYPDMVGWEAGTEPVRRLHACSPQNF